MIDRRIWLGIMLAALTLPSFQPGGGAARGVAEAAVISVTESISVSDEPAAEPSVNISVLESVGVSDGPAAEPSVFISVTESIGVSDGPAAEPSVLIAVTESIDVSDEPTAEPSLFISVSESIGVSDGAAVEPSVLITLAESIGVADAPVVRPPVVIDVVESIAVSDGPQVLPPVLIGVTESIGVVDEPTVVPDPDTDGDGVSDATEAAAPNDGDGNEDGIADALQAGVASLPDAGGVDYVTLQAGGGCTDLLGVAVGAESAMPAQDPGYDYPFGLLEFRLPCTAATLTAIFHGATSLPRRYRSYGPTSPGDPMTIAWYTLPTATFGTATIGGSTVAVVTLALSDGVLGDDTGTDGQIIQTGGPARMVPAIPMFTLGGLLALVLAIGATSWHVLRLGRANLYRRGVGPPGR